MIKTKTKVGLTHQENTVEEISTQKKLPLPGLQKTTTLLLKHWLYEPIDQAVNLASIWSFLLSFNIYFLNFIPF